MRAFLKVLICLCVSTTCLAGQHVFRVEGSDLYLNERAIKIIGLRCSNALISDATTQALIDSLDLYKSYGVNTVSVFFMGSRFGDVKGYRPDASLDPVYTRRMARIIEAADQRGMVVIVGCLYWSTSRAKEDLGHWTQVGANQAVANTVQWLKANDYRNVFVDPDNEGMAGRANDWSTEALIAAAHAVDRSIMVANNTRKKATNSDLNTHFGPKEKGKPWLDSEATPKKAPGGYWGRFSKETHQAEKAYYNYSRVGRYTVEMKAEQLHATRQQLTQNNGYVLASTWLQCSPAQGTKGPFTSLGGRSNLGSSRDEQAGWNTDIDTIHPDAGIRWWMEFVKKTYGPWKPSFANRLDGDTVGPPRMKRREAFLGIHFDFHAGPDCNQVGARTTSEMVELVIDKVKPDYIQIDCKGHRGFSSYPTKVGNPAPGFVGDPLRIWRDVTRQRGIPLFMHYSGVWDDKAITEHPDWAVINWDGKPNFRVTSVFGPYVDALMIPQLRELAGQYGVDGVWVDGDCWGTTVDYGSKAVRLFYEETGAKTAPRKAGDPYWHEWMDFHREAFRRYVRHYVDALKASHPNFQVISNWAFSDHMPEPVSAEVAGLSGDFSPDDSVNSARFAGRCLEDQGIPWDLMSWSFSRKTRKQKPAVQLMQEAALVLALGGGYQAYFKQDRDGALRDPAEMDVMAKVATFCRARQPYCHRSVAMPQIALLYSTEGHYRESPRLFHWAGSNGVKVLRQALTQILKNQYSVQILSEHHLKGKMSEWPVIVVPGWRYLEPAFRDELATYAKTGGRLLLIGPGPATLFRAELPKAGSSFVLADQVDNTFPTLLNRVLPEPIVEVTGARDVDVSTRILNGILGVHLVNTSGPHANAPDGGITEVKPLGPLTVSIALDQTPKSITLQPEGRSLDTTWTQGRARVTVPRLDLYSILVVEP